MSESGELADRNVTLQRSLDNKTWSNVTTPATRTNATGWYSFSTNETDGGTYYYRVSYAGTPAYASAVSSGVKLTIV